MSSFNLKGKNAEAVIYTNNCDEETINQIMELLNSPLSTNSKIRIMPDCHAGAGCVIGTTMTITNKICPNLVGVDIGCGMLGVNFGKINIDNDFLNKLDSICHGIPSGMNVHKNSNKVISDNWQYMCSNSKYNHTKNDYTRWFENLKCYNSLNEKARLIASMGTLGGGNHFIELGKDNENNVYLIIHSGSRNLGTQVAKYYQNLAIKTLNDNRTLKSELIAKLKKEGRDKDIEKELELFDSLNELKVSRDLSYLTDENMQDYLHDMNLCQEFASKNRIAMAVIISSKLFDLKYQTISSNTLEFFGNNFFSYFQTIHNYIDIKNMMLRKGAISANKDEIVLIPLNMRDGSLLCRGLGNPNWNNSAPHGAGRIMSRSSAKSSVNLEEFKKSMQGIYSSTVNSQTIDESPMVYKSMDSIVENIKDTVEIITRIIPIYNFKAAEDIPIWKKEKEAQKRK